MLERLKQYYTKNKKKVISAIIVIAAVIIYAVSGIEVPVENITNMIVG